MYMYYYLKKKKKDDNLVTGKSKTVNTASESFKPVIVTFHIPSQVNLFIEVTLQSMLYNKYHKRNTVS